MYLSLWELRATKVHVYLRLQTCPSQSACVLTASNMSVKVSEPTLLGHESECSSLLEEFLDCSHTLFFASWFTWALTCAPLSPHAHPMAFPLLLKLRPPFPEDTTHVACQIILWIKLNMYATFVSILSICMFLSFGRTGLTGLTGLSIVFAAVEKIKSMHNRGGNYIFTSAFIHISVPASST
jgi:hypothetical protein